MSDIDSSSLDFIESSINDNIGVENFKKASIFFDVQKKGEISPQVFDGINNERNECLKLKEGLKNEVKNETKESLEKEAFIDTMRNWMYEMLGIDSDQKKNGAIDNFTKGIVDEFIIGNYEFAVLIWETKGGILLDALKQLTTLEGFKAVLKGIGASIGDLFTGNAYEKGKSVAELGLLFIGVGGVYKGTKLLAKGVKKGAAVARTGVLATGIALGSEVSFALGKTVIQGSVDKKKGVRNTAVKRNIDDVRYGVESIVPIKKFNMQEVVERSIMAVVERKKVKDGSFIGTQEYLSGELKKLSDSLELEVPISLKNYVNNGAEGVLYAINGKQFDGTDMLVKIASKNDKTNIHRLRHHQEFYSVYQDWKKNIWSENLFSKFPSTLKIPKVIDHKGYYLMENLKDYVSLADAFPLADVKRHLGSRWARKKTDAFDHVQISELGKILGRETLEYHPDAVRSVMSQVNIFELENFLRYSNSVGLRHGEFDFNHLMVHKDTSVKGMYIVDFGKGELDTVIKDRSKIRLGDINFSENYFDLEHFRDHWEVLKDMAKK